jgi:hypothetical protein
MAGAELAYLCQSAKLAALEAENFVDDPRVGVEHFDAVLPESSPTA